MKLSRYILALGLLGAITSLSACADVPDLFGVSKLFPGSSVGANLTPRDYLMPPTANSHYEVEYHSTVPGSLDSSTSLDVCSLETNAAFLYATDQTSKDKYIVSSLVNSDGTVFFGIMSFPVAGLTASGTIISEASGSTPALREKLVGRETLITKAGTFDCVKIELSYDATDSYSMYYWLAPKVGYPIKYSYSYHNTDGTIITSGMQLSAFSQTGATIPSSNLPDPRVRIFNDQAEFWFPVPNVSNWVINQATSPHNTEEYDWRCQLSGYKETFLLRLRNTKRAWVPESSGSLAVLASCLEGNVSWIAPSNSIYATCSATVQDGGLLVTITDQNLVSQLNAAHPDNAIFYNNGLILNSIPEAIFVKRVIPTFVAGG